MCRSRVTDAFETENLPICHILKNEVRPRLGDDAKNVLAPVAVGECELSVSEFPFGLVVDTTDQRVVRIELSGSVAPQSKYYLHGEEPLLPSLPYAHQG